MKNAVEVCINGELNLALVYKLFSDQLLLSEQVNFSPINVSRPRNNLTFPVFVHVCVKHLSIHSNIM